MTLGTASLSNNRILGRVKRAAVELWPSLPRFVRKHNWIAGPLESFGLVSPPTTVAPALNDITVLPKRADLDYSVTGSLIALQDRDVAKAMLPFLRQIFPDGQLNYANSGDCISEFRSIFLNSPITNNSGGANYTTGLVLFLIARHLDPTLIIESGLLRGMSSLLLRAAAPNAKIHGFDLNFSILHRTANVQYHQCDWMAADIKATDSALAYFDDHINQAQRVIEAHSRGFRYLIFDDSWSWGAISGCGGVPLPSIDMLLSDDINVGDTVQWFEAGELKTYTQTKQMADLSTKAREVIKSAYDIPSLYRQTGIAPTSALKYVELI